MSRETRQNAARLWRRDISLVGGAVMIYYAERVAEFLFRCWR